jgi:hypothetical protein
MSKYVLKVELYSSVFVWGLYVYVFLVSDFEVRETALIFSCIVPIVVLFSILL